MQKKTAQAVRCDVAVLGGGVSGVVAALAAARQGAHVLLVEREDFLGGVLVSGLGTLGFKDRAGNTVIGGIAQEIVDRLGRMHGTLGHNPCPVLNSLTPVNAALVRLLLFEMCGEAGVQMLLGCTFVAGKVYGHRLRRVYVQGRAKRFEVEAQVFIDATGDGDLCVSIGIPFEKGGPDGELQPASLIFAVSGVKKEKLLEYVERYPSEVETPQGYEMNVDAAFFRTVQGYNLLGLDALIRRARANGDYVDVPRDRFSIITHPNDDTTIINNTRLTDFDGTDLWQLSRGTGEACRQVEELLQFMPKYIPGYEQCALSFIAPVLGVRETRRFLGRRCLEEKDVRAGAIPRDTIALCGYNVDIHHGRDEGSELYIVERGYGIPYGCMVPGQMDGVLFTGRLICADRVAYGSSRVMGTCMALGEAAGLAAALCVRLNCTPAQVPVENLRALLKENGAVLTIPQEVASHENVEKSAI